jgi:hypothetical protein
LPHLTLRSAQAAAATRVERNRPAQNLTAHVGADHKRGMQPMWPQIIIAAEAQQRARNDALAMLLTGQVCGQS